MLPKVSSDSHDSDTKTDSDTSPEDPRAHTGKDDATAELVQKLTEEDLSRKESPVKSPTKKLTSALKFWSRVTSRLMQSKKQTSSRTSKKLLKKKPLKETPLLPNRYVVRGSPYYSKEHRNAPPEPVGSNILQNK
eukprot:scaffold63765_cov29-Attheya_sp.AAC.2